MKMESAKAVFVFSLAMSIGFYYVYAKPHLDTASSTPILGKSVGAVQFEDLTVIARMPFLSHVSKAVDASKLQIDNNIFYIPPSKQVVEAEPVNVEDFAPAEVVIPKPDYKAWAKTSLRVQSIAVNGVIINDKFYRLGAKLADPHAFEDGTYFTGKVQAIHGQYVVVEIFDGSTVELKLGG